MTMPWIALVCDISGVCRVVGTFEITSKPTKAARTKIVTSVITLIGQPFVRVPIATDSNDRRSPRRLDRSQRVPPRRALVLDLAAVGDAGGGNDVVLEVDRELALLGDQQAEQVLQVLGVELRGGHRHLAGE